MSISLNVVSIAFVFWASFSRCAIRCLIRFILTRCSDRVPVISVVGSAGGNLTVAASIAWACRIAATGIDDNGAWGGGGGGLDVGGAAVDGAAGGGGGTALAAGGEGGGGLGSAATASFFFGGAGAPPPAKRHLHSLPCWNSKPKKADTETLPHSFQYYTIMNTQSL
jgi:hypothetical protein